MTEDLSRGSETESGSQIAATESTSSQAMQGEMLTGAEGAEALVGQATVVVQAPLAGAVDTYPVQAGQRYVIDFDPSAAQIRVAGDDLVLTFANGGQIVFQGIGAIDPALEAPIFEIAGTDVPAAVLYQQAVALAGPAVAPEGTPTLETAAGAAGGPAAAQGTGQTRYDDDTGQVIPLLAKQGVIPGVEMQFGLITLENFTPLGERAPEVLNTPPQADPVLTPADTEGEVPGDIVDLLGGEISIAFFKQLNVTGEIGDNDNFQGPVDMGGLDAETPLSDLTFTLLSQPAFGTLVLVSGGSSSIMNIGDTFTSADTVWWIATTADVSQLEILAPVTFEYSVTDADGGTATAPVVITFRLSPPTTTLEVFAESTESGCLNEDTQGALFFTATPGDGVSEITQIVISDFPVGGAADAWVVDAASVNLFGLTLNVDYTASYDAVTGTLTIDILGGVGFGDMVQGTVNVTPNPDSDVDADLTINATATNGVDSADGAPTVSTIGVDADADASPGATGGVDDGDGDVLSVSATLVDSVDADSVFGIGESGTLMINASFDDYQDGSETHTVTVTAPSGFTIDSLDGSLPAGVTVSSSSDGEWVFDVATDGTASGSISFDLIVTNVSNESGTHDFSVEAKAEETNTGDIECDPSAADNVATVTDTATATVGSVAPPEVILALPQEVDCIQEDSTVSDADNTVTLTVNPDGDDLLTQIVLSGFDQGGDWTYDLTGLDTDGAGTDVTVVDNIAGDGTVTITFASPSNSAYVGTFAVEPPADSDIDHPTISATATVVDPADSALTTDGTGDIDIHVDADADAGPGATGGVDDGDGDVLSVSATLVDSVDADTTFHQGESGTLTINASFDDYQDGSETHTVTVTAPSGFTIDGLDGSLPAGVTVSISSDGEWVFDVATDGTASGSISFDLIVTNVSNESGTHDFSVEAKAEETSTGDIECDPSAADNVATVTDTATATALDDTPTFNAGTVLTHDESAGLQSVVDDDLNGAAEDDINPTIGGLPGDLQTALSGLSIVQGDIVGVAQDTATFSYGANGPAASDPVKLSLTQGAQSTLFASTGDADDGGTAGDESKQPVYLYQISASIIVGVLAYWDGDDWVDPDSVNSDAVVANGDYVTVDETQPEVDIAFVIYMDAPAAPTGTDNDSDADVYFVQTTAIWHDQPSDPDESDADPNLETQAVTVVVTDADNDSVNGTFTVRVEDDGPTLTVVADGEAGAALATELDETVGADRYNAPETEDLGGNANTDDAGPGIGQVTTSVTGGLTTLFAVGGDAGSDGQASLTGELSFVGLTAGGAGALTTLSATDGGAITLFLTLGGVLEGRDTDGQVVFTIAIVGAPGSEQLQTTLFEAIDHGADGNLYDSELSLLLDAAGTVQLQYEVTRTDNDGDTVTVSDQIDLITEQASLFSFDDDGPAVLAKTDLIFANSSATGTGVFDYSIGADERTDYSSSNSDFSAITLSGMVGAVAISTPTVTWTSEDANSAVFAVSFFYAANPLTPLDLTEATGTLTFDKADGTYTLALDVPLEGFTILTTSATISSQSYDLVVQGASQPEIVVSKLADDFFVRFSADQAVQGNTPVPLHVGALNTDLSFVEGDLFTAAQTWVSISGSANGVAGDTLQAGEVLNMDFYTASPGANPTPGPGDAEASGLFIKLDQLGAGEDFVVVLKLVSASDPTDTITRTVVVEYGDIWLSSEVNPYGITFADDSDGVVIIESNDYNFGGEDYLIIGAQLLVSSEGVTGSAIDLNRGTGDSGASAYTDSLDVSTSDNDVIKVVDIGIITSTTGTQDADLSFEFQVIDDDGDATSTQTLDVLIEGGTTFAGTAAAESIHGSSGVDTIGDGAGADIIHGGGGADIINLANDGTSDVLVYSLLTEAGDVVTGFNTAAPGAGGDIIDIGDLLDTGTFAGTTTAQAIAGGYLQVNDSGGNAVVQVDLDGGANSWTTVVTLNGVLAANVLDDNIVVD